MNKLSKILISKTQDKIVSEKIININRSLEEVVIKRMEFESTKVDYLGYRKYVPTVADQHVEAMNEFNIKLKGKKAKVAPSIDLDDNPITAYDFYYLINPELESNTQILQNTTVFYSWLHEQLTESRGSIWLDDLYRGYSVINEYNPEDETLIHKMTLYIPRAINNAYYTINGNNYFPVWFKVTQCVENKKSKGKHEGRTSIKVYHTDASYSSMHSTMVGGVECVVWEKYKELRNPFAALPDYRLSDLNIAFSNKILFTTEKATVLDLDYTVIANTYNAYLRDVDPFVDPLDAVSNTSMDIISGLQFFIERVTPIKFKIHAGLDGFLAKKIHEYLRKIESSAKSTKLHNLKNRRSLNSHYITTTIVKNSHYTLSNSVNSRTRHMLSQYTSLRGDTEGKKHLKRANRQFKKNMVGIASFDYMVQSSNIGGGGSLAYGVNDKYLKTR